MNSIRSFSNFLSPRFYFIRLLPPLTPAQLARPALLPKKTRSSPPITLVLDLDETLVHCSTGTLDPHDLQFTVDFNQILYTVDASFKKKLTLIGFMQNSTSLRCFSKACFKLI
jgi:hypothetical protein